MQMMIQVNANTKILKIIITKHTKTINMPTSYPLYKDLVRNWVLNNIPLNAKILDIGAGCGTYSDLLRGYGYKMDAIEIWKPYIDKYELKKKYDVVYHKNILAIDFVILDKYDFFILGDVLEHLTVEEGQLLMLFLKQNKKKYIVAVPYQMEQGEYEGNTHETHLQPDLTPDIMKQRYPDLELLYGNNYYGYYINKKVKHEKAFVLYADESYLDLVDVCCNSIRSYSDIPIFVYLLNSKTKVNIKNTLSIEWQCDVIHLKKRKEYIDREDKQIYKLLIERPKIVAHALENFAETVAYIDTDSIATKYVDSIFDYFDAESSYPYFTEGIYEYLIINGRGGAESREDLSGTLETPACELFGSNQMERHNTGYRQTGYFVAGQKCIDFLELWYYRCNHPVILKDNSKYASFNEETILQTMLYDYKAYKGLPLVYVNGLRKGLEFKGYSYMVSDWFKVPANEKELLFYHGEKNIDKINEFINILCQ